MKGFKKDGKFRPTGKKSGLKKDQIRSKKTLPQKGNAPRGEFQMESTKSRGVLPSSRFGSKPIHGDEHKLNKKLNEEQMQIGRADRGRDKQSLDDKNTLTDSDFRKLDQELQDAKEIALAMDNGQLPSHLKNQVDHIVKKISDVRIQINQKGLHGTDSSRNKQSLDAHPNPSPNYQGKETKAKSLKDKERFVDRAIAQIEEDNLTPENAPKILRENGFEPDVIREAIRIRGKFS